MVFIFILGVRSASIRITVSIAYGQQLDGGNANTTVHSFVQVVAHAVGVQFLKFGTFAHVGCYDATKYKTLVSFRSKPTFLVTYILLFRRSTDINYALACDTRAFH